MSNQSQQRPAAPAPRPTSTPEPSQAAAPAQQIDAAQHSAIATAAAERAERSAKLAGDSAEAAVALRDSVKAAHGDAVDAATQANRQAERAEAAATNAERALAQLQPIGDGLTRARDEAAAAATRATAAADAVDLASRKAAVQLQGGGDAPARLRCTAARRGVSDYAPRASADGTSIVLNYAPRGDGDGGMDNPEASVGLDGYRDMRSGVRVDVPAGYVGEVTTAGKGGERLVAALLYGDATEELVVRVWNRSGGFMTIRAGTELARVTLRRLLPVELDYVDPYAPPAPTAAQ